MFILSYPFFLVEKLPTKNSMPRSANGHQISGNHFFTQSCRGGAKPRLGSAWRSEAGIFRTLGNVLTANMPTIYIWNICTNLPKRPIKSKSRYNLLRASIDLFDIRMEKTEQKWSKMQGVCKLLTFNTNKFRLVSSFWVFNVQWWEEFEQCIHYVSQGILMGGFSLQAKIKTIPLLAPPEPSW